MIRYTYFLVVLLFCLISKVEGQNVLGKPEAFVRPLDQGGYDLGSKLKPTKAPWVVFSDRDNNQTYEKDRKTPKRTINFKDWFYVLDTKNDWIRLGKGTTTGRKMNGKFQDYGWIRKNRMLLWSSGLLDPTTRINRKVFLLNRADDINNLIERVKGGQKKELVDIFNGPGGDYSKNNKNIYEFYFVLKKETTKGGLEYYLLSKSSKISSDNVEESIVGWIRQNRLSEWDTRIALEPNFSQEAFDERKQNSTTLKILAFGNQTSAESYASNGKVNKNDVFWNNDPVLFETNQLASSDPKRFNGGVVRFPLLSQFPNYYRSGVITKIAVVGEGQKKLEDWAEVSYDGFRTAIQQSRIAKDNYNVLYLVEGTKGMQRYKQSIIESIKDVQLALSGVQNVKYGAAIYRDIAEREQGRLFDIEPLAANTAKITEFLHNSEFNNWYDNDAVCSMYYGLYQSLLEAGFNKNHTNIIIWIGNNGDYRYDIARKYKDNKDETYVSSDDLASILGEYNVHLMGLQCINNYNRASRSFIKGLNNIILESAKYQYEKINRVKEVESDITIQPPFMPELDMEACTKLEGGVGLGKICRPSGQSLSNKEVSSNIKAFSGSVFTFTNKFWKQVSTVINDGNSVKEIDQGTVGPGMVVLIGKLLRDSGKWSRDDVRKLLREKFRLYAEVYIPKKVYQATHPAFSQVLFMPEEDLEDYLKTINDLSICRDYSIEQQRECLYAALVELYRKFSGNNELGKKTSISDLNTVVQGLEKEGLVLQGNMSRFKIKDIRNEKKVNDTTISMVITQYLQNTNKLKQILKEGENYEFAFKSLDNTYFWIPVEYATF